jgi:hypothetical protein
MCVLVSQQIVSKTFLILRKTERYMIINTHRPCCKVKLLLSDLDETSHISTDFRKIFKYGISKQSVQWESSCSMRTDGRTDGREDMTNLAVAFRHF